uniref:Uncharacterized protein n=1 Tax=Glossina pallidipes TaxID=7398 RepID=A0A1A9ZII0_GLOPL
MKPYRMRIELRRHAENVKLLQDQHWCNYLSSRILIHIKLEVADILNCPLTSSPLGTLAQNLLQGIEVHRENWLATSINTPREPNQIFTFPMAMLCYVLNGDYFLPVE